jgi:TolB-like protein/class 3 adenylate cyclase
VEDETDVQRRLVAVFAADVEGYSRLMGADEVGTLKGLTERRAILDKAIGDHRGRIANTAGDSVLAEFGSAVEAVRCAVEAQAALGAANAGLPVDKCINFRIGIHVGDVMVRRGDLFGDGVNIAARLQTLAQPGGVCVSGETYGQVRKVLPVAFSDMGARQVKNIDEPVRAYAVAAASQSIALSTASVLYTNRPLPLPDKPSIAVLPFQNMSGDPEQDYFADGMVEDITTALSHFKALFVIARNSSFTYKGKTIDIKQVGRELGVRYILEGSVRRAGERVRITGQLIEAATGAHLWANRFDGTLEDVFGLQDRVAASVASAIAPRLTLAAIDLRKRKPLESWDSYDHYLRGLELLFPGTPDTIGAAQQFFRKSIELDSGFGLGYARVAFCTHFMRSFYHLPISEEQRVEAVKFASRAIELAPDDEVALTSAAFVFAQLDNYNYQRGAELADRALALNPNSTSGWHARGWMSVLLGEPLRAVEELERAMRLNPLDSNLLPSLMFGIAAANLFLGKLDDSLGWARKILAQQPTDIAGLMLVFFNASASGRALEAKDAVERLKAAHPDLRASYVKQVYRVGKPELQGMVNAMIDRLGLPE